MYYDYFSLDRHPFRITPDTSLFFSGGNQGRGVVLDAMLYAIETGEGILKVVGEVGSGKTMLCRMLEERLPESTEVVYLANPNLSPEEILYAVAFELKLPIRAGTSKLLVMQQLQSYLLQQHADNRRVLVVIEEAQGMPVETLEEIRLFSNLETHRDKLMQIIMFGQPELDRNLSVKHIRQLRERITHSFYLSPLTTEESAQYIRFRLGAAGCPCPQLLTPQAEWLISRASGGLTRRINILADKALLAAYAGNAIGEGKEISATMAPVVRWRHVYAAIRDSDYSMSFWQALFSPLRMISASVLVGFVAMAILLWPETAVISSQTSAVPSGLPPIAAQIAVADGEELVAPITESKPNFDPVPIAEELQPFAEVENATSSSAIDQVDLSLEELVVAAGEELEIEAVDSITPEYYAVADLTPQALEIAGTASPETDAVIESPGQAKLAVDRTPPAFYEAELTEHGAPRMQEFLQAPAAAAISSSTVSTQASTQISTTAPAKNLVQQRVLASIPWLSNADREGYTVQFVSGETERIHTAESFLQTLSEAGLIAESYVCISANSGRSNWAIKYGNFSGVSSAQEFINTLPAHINDHKPFVQNMSAVECNTNNTIAALISE